MVGQTIVVTGSGAVAGLTGPGTLIAARLTAAAANATAVITDAGAGGATIGALAAVINTTDQLLIPCPFRGQISVTLTGAGATLVLYV